MDDDGAFTNFTCSTRYCASFEVLCRGEIRSYCLDNLISLKSEDNSPFSFSTAVEKLHQHIEDIFNALEIESDRKVEKFTIGKSSVKQRHKPGGGFVAFDIKNANTWKLSNGANGRWREYLGEGYDGLVVLCATPREVLPKCGMRIGPHDYALALEQRLIQLYSFEKFDERIGNKSFESGGRPDEERSYSGLVYVAYKLSEATEESCNGDIESDGVIHISDDDDEINSAAENFGNNVSTNLPAETFGNNVSTHLPAENFGNNVSTDLPAENFGNNVSTNLPAEKLGNHCAVEQLKKLRSIDSATKHVRSNGSTDYADEQLGNSRSNNSAAEYLGSNGLTDVEPEHLVNSNRNNSKIYRNHIHYNETERIEMQSRPFKCETCGKSFKQKHHLDGHRKIHNNEKPYSCNACNKTFRQKAHLRTHELLHSGVKPYLCKICKKSFRQSAHLKRHMQRNIHESDNLNI